MDNIGERIKEERQLRGWSQRDLSREAGVNTDTISGIETGQHEPRPSTLRKLAEGLGIEVRDLFAEPVLPKADAPSLGRARTLPEWARTSDLNTLSLRMSELSMDELDDLARSVALTSSNRGLTRKDLPLPRDEAMARTLDNARALAVHDEYKFSRRDAQPPKEFRLAFAQMLDALTPPSDAEAHRHQQNRGIEEAG